MAEKKNNARLNDWMLFQQAGIDPLTRQPTRVSPNPIVGNIKQNLRIVDEQDAVNRFQWYNLPDGLTSQDVERMLYYRGTLMFFYMEPLDKFFLLPYHMDGGGDESAINVYGQYNRVGPLPFYGTMEAKKNIWLGAIVRDVVREVRFDEEVNFDSLLNSCVLLYDYTPQQSQVPTARQILNDPILELMAEAYPMARTSLMAHSGIKGLRVPSEVDAPNVSKAADGVRNAALNGKIWVPIVGMQEFQDLTDGGSTSPEDYLLYMQSLDNFRLSLYGLKAGGIFEKDYKLQDEQSMNTGNASLILDDALKQRQHFCDVVNSIWGLGIWCDVSETAIGMDKNADGMVADETDQSGTQEGEQPQ